MVVASRKLPILWRERGVEVLRTTLRRRDGVTARGKIRLDFLSDIFLLGGKESITSLDGMVSNRREI